MKILITGTAGFIGSFLVKRLVANGDEIVGLDNINAYYDVNLKYGRLADSGIEKTAIKYNQFVKSKTHPNYKFIQLDIEDKENVEKIFKQEKFDKVCHLAAQAGVRYSITNPDSYISSNVIGFMNILEACRYHNIQHLVYASSSSVYGLNSKMPFSTEDRVDHPISIYAASKKTNELMAHTYSHLFQLPTTGLRFFTVYGPWGRPDMAVFLFTKAIMNNQPIEVYNNGKMERDFTYIDDIAEGLVRIVSKGKPKQNYKLYNIGNNRPVQLLYFIKEIEKNTKRQANINWMPLQPGDVEKTWADVSALMQDYDYAPNTQMETGVKNFVHWYKHFYSVE